eukprot:1158605-Pelagomonas_calceolata.AAC.1
MQSALTLCPPSKARAPRHIQGAAHRTTLGSSSPLGPCPVVVPGPPRTGMRPLCNLRCSTTSPKPRSGCKTAWATAGGANCCKTAWAAAGGANCCKTAWATLGGASPLKSATRASALK